MTSTQPERSGTAHIPTVRNANLDDLLAILNAQQARKVDLVVPADKLRFVDAMLVIAGQEMIMDEDGFTDPNGTYWPTQVFDDHIAERLDAGQDCFVPFHHRKRGGPAQFRVMLSAAQELVPN